MNTLKISIIVPCYNEYERLPVSEFETFLKNFPQAHLCFVNDASSDQTIDKLNALKKDFSNQILILSNEKNSGKAASVRNGILHCDQEKIAPNFAYLDADLATSLEECYSYLSFLANDKKQFVFASRILKVGSIVERKFSRFLFGRIIATFISKILDIKMYDTQCGCKVFDSQLSEVLFEKPFISKWLFDVELFSRLICAFGKENALEKMEEIPVKRWVDQGDSKVKISYFFRLWYDLFVIRKTHRRNLKKDQALT